MHVAYSFRQKFCFIIFYVKFMYFGSERISNLGPRIYSLVPGSLKYLGSVGEVITSKLHLKYVLGHCFALILAFAP